MSDPQGPSVPPPFSPPGPPCYFSLCWKPKDESGEADSEVCKTYSGKLCVPFDYGTLCDGDSSKWRCIVDNDDIYEVDLDPRSEPDWNLCLKGNSTKCGIPVQDPKTTKFGTGVLWRNGRQWWLDYKEQPGKNPTYTSPILQPPIPATKGKSASDVSLYLCNNDDIPCKKSSI